MLTSCSLGVSCSHERGPSKRVTAVLPLNYSEGKYHYVTPDGTSRSCVTRTSGADETNILRVLVYYVNQSYGAHFIPKPTVYVSTYLFLAILWPRS